MSHTVNIALYMLNEMYEDLFCVHLNIFLLHKVEVLSNKIYKIILYVITYEYDKGVYRIKIYSLYILFTL